MTPLDRHTEALDHLFRGAVAAIDAGDVPALDRLLAEHPGLACDRLASPGPWLREAVGDALDGFFRRPYLLWFVAEDPVRRGRLPANIAEVARAIIGVARHAGAERFQEQLDYALRLVAWSGVAWSSGVQLALIDVLVDAGAALEGTPNDALVNGHVAAAEHLVARGARMTFATALCLGRWDDAARLAPAASAAERQFGLVLAALHGNAEALTRALALGADLNRPSPHLHAHGTPLHHAVSSGSLDAVRVLVEAGAALGTRDTLWNGTPLDWAEYCRGQHAGDERETRYAEIITYLRRNGAAER